MFDIGWAELVLIAIVILFAFGPEDIPKLMYGLGRIMRRFRYMRYALSSQFEDFMEKAEKSGQVQAKPMTTKQTIEKDPEGDEDEEYMEMLPPPEEVPGDISIEDLPDIDNEPKNDRPDNANTHGK